MRALVCALAALALLAGCTHGNGPDSPPPLPSARVSIAVTQQPRGVAPPSNVVTFPTPPAPDDATRAAYLAALDLADTDIVHGKPDTAVNRGIDQCGTFQQFPDDYDRQIGIAHERFTSPDHPFGFNIGTTKYILQMVHKYLCPDYPLPAELVITPVTPSPEDTGDRPVH